MTAMVSPLHRVGSGRFAHKRTVEVSAQLVKGKWANCPQRSYDPPMAWTATNSEGYEAPAALAADIVVLSVRNARLEALTIEREDGRRALPGGFVQRHESPEQTARRVLGDKTG